MASMHDAIRGFPRQLEYEPQIINAERLARRKRFVVAGMGGSGLAADIIKTWNPRLALTTHQDYGLPDMLEADLQEALIIVSSHSGNTEEALSAFQEATKRGLDLAVVTTGGELLRHAQSQNIAHIIMPHDGLQPRSARGYSFLSLMKLMGEEQAIRDVRSLASSLNVDECAVRGRGLAEAVKGRIPVIYASRRNRSLAYNWKVVFNETGKVPAFYNIFPELNHNEIEGFSDKILSKHFHAIFLHDKDDHERIRARMDVLGELYGSHHVPTEHVAVEGANPVEKIFSSLLLADFAALSTAEIFGHDPEHVRMIEDFKHALAKQE